MSRTEIEKKPKQTNFWLAAGICGASYLVSSLMNKRREQKSREPYSFSDKTIFITGGSRGLGLVLARHFAAEGARVAICARDESELERAKTDLENNGAEVFTDVCDVREQSQVEATIKKITDEFGQIDVLVNNAGVIQVGPLEVQTQKDFEDAMRVHFWGAYYTMQAVIPAMRERGAGKIVNISSIGGKMNVPHLAPYCASKFALVGLSGAMNVELAKDGISVTTVCPGLMRTGSHVNAVFKGKNELEFAWFSISNALPFSSVSAESAAREIIEACRAGKAEAIISIQAEIAAKMNALFPETVAGISGLVNQVLPGEGGIGEDHALGKDSRSFASPSFLTENLDKASIRNNELETRRQVH